MQKEIQSLVINHSKELENITTKFNELLDKETKAKIESQQTVGVLNEKCLQMQTRIDDFQVSINELKTREISLSNELAKMTTAHHAAENRAIAAESTATAQTEQIKDLKQTIKNIQDLSKPKRNKV